MTFAGQLKERIRFEKTGSASGVVKSADLAFAPVEGLASVPAKIRTLRGDEVSRAASLEGVSTHMIIVRHQAALDGLNTSWRVVDTRRPSDVYDIKLIDRQKAARREIYLTCELKGQ